MSDFTLPTNIKQIGSIGDGLRIYIEDYVCTFLHQYAEAGGYGERLAFLVGRQLVIDGQPILFINGAIHGKHVEENDGFMRFTEKSRDYAEAMLDEHFPMMEIVGWMQSQPSYGTYLNQHYATYHLRQFRKAYQVMYVLDPIERSNAFYIQDPDALTPSDRLAETSGYFIYFEKNLNMHEYMLANKVVEYTPKNPTLIERATLEYAGEEGDGDGNASQKGGFFGRKEGRSESKSEDNNGSRSEDRDDDHFEDRFEDRYKDVSDGDDYADESYAGYAARARHSLEPEEIIRRHQADKARRKAPVQEQKRALNMVASLCAILFIVSFILGVGFIRSQDRIDTLEEEIRLLNIGMRNVIAHVGSDDSTASPVFAHDALTNDRQGQAGEGHGGEGGEDGGHAETDVHGGVQTDAGVDTQTDTGAGAQAGTQDGAQAGTQAGAQAGTNETGLPTTEPTTPPAGQDTGQGQANQDTATGETSGAGNAQSTANTSTGEQGAITFVPDTYTIQYGDSLISISMRFFDTAEMVESIMELNGILDPNHIVAGRTIALPSR